ncbi:hypothetical protein KAR91_49890 [Candidatus Pacearchaeota archaeon]|nr:hypothetical protein [Candidatus Pacearchaeota archaeon]
MSRLSKKEVRESLEYWQKVLKLTNWTIEFAVVTEEQMLNAIEENPPEGGWPPEEKDGSAQALMVWIRPEEQRAKILFHREIKDDPEYGSVFNIETTCIHELLHIMFNAQFKIFPKYIRTHKKIHNFEEWLCNRFSRLIYDFGESGIVDSNS